MRPTRNGARTQVRSATTPLTHLNVCTYVRTSRHSSHHCPFKHTTPPLFRWHPALHCQHPHHCTPFFDAQNPTRYVLRKSSIACVACFRGRNKPPPRHAPFALRGSAPSLKVHPRAIAVRLGNNGPRARAFSLPRFFLFLLCLQPLPAVRREGPHFRCRQPREQKENNIKAKAEAFCRTEQTHSPPRADPACEVADRATTLP